MAARKSCHSLAVFGEHGEIPSHFRSHLIVGAAGAVAVMTIFVAGAASASVPYDRAGEPDRRETDHVEDRSNGPEKTRRLATSDYTLA